MSATDSSARMHGTAERMAMAGGGMSATGASSACVLGPAEHAPEMMLEAA